ncbi:uncharacterized protein LOC117645853 isoform X2 [Thrips palmi]|uniref:Uncharacterized protein LOC117645853 isoform X2 n=1 Tax=Thrips palmi TaxID=161013 RepID=A0A6P8ZNE7_THRPL|nr:uncharacterized protein LOC117645853 isoform X2 [Thrips palmi]
MSNLVPSSSFIVLEYRSSRMPVQLATKQRSFRADQQFTIFLSHSCVTSQYIRRSEESRGKVSPRFGHAVRKRMTMAEDGAWTKALSCPLTWDTPEMTCMSLPLSTAGGVADELDSLPTPWHRLVDMITLAYSYLTEGRETDGVALLRNCYMMLLPQPFCQHDCAIIGEYRNLSRLRGAEPRAQRPGGGVALHGRQARRDLGGQGAALEDGPPAAAGAAHRARPGHGAGHEAQGQGRGAAAPGGGLATLPRPPARAHQRRRRPHPVVPPSAIQLYKMRFCRACQIRGLTKTTVAEAERLLGRCKAITGDKSYLHLRLAGLCRRQGGRSEEATRHYEEAIRLNPADAAMIRLYHLPNSPCDTCGRVCSDGNEGGEIRCHHERLARVYQHTLTSNTYA